MSFEHPRNAFADPALPTLADLLARVLAEEGLPLARRREMASAIRVLETWFERPLEAMPASTDYLRRRFEGFHHEHAGVTRKRVQNVRSLLLKALCLAGLPTTLKPYQVPLSPAWQDLHDRLPNSYARTELTRLMRYCSVRGVTPRDMDDRVSADFLDALVEESLIKRPRIRHQSMCRLWNRMVGQVEGWPQVHLAVPRYRETYGLPWEAFPASLAADVERYLDRLANVDSLAEDGPDRPLRPRSIETRRTQLRLGASALVQGGIEPGMLSSLNDLVDPQRVRAILTFFLARSGNKTSSHVAGIGLALLGVARHHVTLAPEDLAEVERLVRKVKVVPQGMAEKNRKRLRQFETRAAQRRLLMMPFETLAELHKRDDSSRRMAVQASKAVALLILAFAPMRVSNLAQLHLEQHLRWHRPKRQGALSITIVEDEVKNAQHLDYLLPAPVADQVRRYVEVFRPRLVGSQDTSHLFPGRKLRAKRADSLSRQLRGWVKAETGFDFHPHLMRHIAAKIMADRKPGSYEAIRRLLGHKRAETTYRIYEGEETLSAVRLYDRLILELLGIEDDGDA